MTGAPGTPLGLIGIFLNGRAVRVGLVVATASILIFAVWSMSQGWAACNTITDASRYVADRYILFIAVLMIWSFFVFLTVMPLGTATILLAGYFLGPVAGAAQFASLVLASLILYETGRERDPVRLERDLSAYPKLARYAGFARRQGFWFSVLMRLVPVVPSAAASLAAAFFSVSRRDFILATLLAGWVRPVGFAVLGSLGRFAPICGIDPSIALSGA